MMSGDPDNAFFAPRTDQTQEQTQLPPEQPPAAKGAFPVASEEERYPPATSQSNLPDEPALPAEKPLSEKTKAEMEAGRKRIQGERKIEGA